MMKLLRWALFGLAALCWSTVSVAKPASELVKNNPTENPYKTMQQVVQQVFPKLRKLHDEKQLTPEKTRRIILHYVMPYIDYRYSAYMVIGRSLPKTTKAQRERFVKAFYTYLVNTYSEVLGRYDQQKVVIERPRGYVNGQRVMTVPAKIIQQGRPSIHLQFKFRKLRREHAWLAYDMIAEGVSLLSANQSEVGGLIQRKGIDTVSNLLENKQIKVQSSQNERE
ncbi:MAG: Intermembrane phospholipid transport system binding protein MlaC [Candidatus Celerinatantimonas neptuna]|nr:MAG: Intermembrane phospholipid transport system binding protein MlaC [Candidatus Celerinatantimonas neptuna]